MQRLPINGVSATHDHQHCIHSYAGFPGNQAASTRMGRALAAMLGLSAAAYGLPSGLY